MPKYGKLFYTKIYEKDLQCFVEHDLSKQAQRLYIFLSLNFNTYNEFTDHLNDSQIAEMLGTHRTTIMRARAELEDTGLIVEDNDTVASQRYRYHLPMKAKVDSKANSKREDNNKEADKREQEKSFSERRSLLENDLKRRLTPSEVQSLRKKYGLS